MKFHDFVPGEKEKNKQVCYQCIYRNMQGTVMKGKKIIPNDTASQCKICIYDLITHVLYVYNF